ncbi:hypothetical protein HOY82DRAFT_671392 [Tuber indicum]|nr:hypothetical protein HOY82DRAFT_671392 [Tuber indicum]
MGTDYSTTPPPTYSLHQPRIRAPTPSQREIAIRRYKPSQHPNPFWLYPEWEAGASLNRYPWLYVQPNQHLELSHSPAHPVTLSVTLEDLGWGVYLKIYPKFKTRHNISVSGGKVSEVACTIREPGHGCDIPLTFHGGIQAEEVVLLRQERQDLGIGFWGPICLIHCSGGCSLGLDLLGWEVCSGRWERAPSRRVG